MDAWLERTENPLGAILSFEQMWALVKPWYSGRMSPEWRGRSAPEAQAILDGVGLSGAFWALG